MQTRLAFAAGLAAVLAAASAAVAADLPARASLDGAGVHGGAQGDGYADAWRHGGLVTQADTECLDEWRRINPPGAPVRFTNSLCDPTYIGSGYGLARPSYYGTLPRLGQTAYGWNGREGP